MGIIQFMNDIKNSVERPGDYLHSLETTPDLQDRFKKTIDKFMVHDLYECEITNLRNRRKNRFRFFSTEKAY